MSHTHPKRIAVIGSGISGLGAAYLLHPHHHVTVYEKNAVPGGHSRTVEARTPEGAVPVDTGFIVYNRRNYPLLSGLFARLDVPVVESNMSFGVSVDGGKLEYGTGRLGDLFARKRNLFTPDFWRMTLDIFRFNRRAGRFLHAAPSVSLGECLDQLGVSNAFREYYLLAMGCAIWSASPQEMLNFPACTFVRFFENHGLLTVTDHPQWYTVKGGSREYVKRLTEPFRDRIRTHCGAVSVSRGEQGATVHDSQGGAAVYDEVVFACHADLALALIQHPTEDERRVLGAFRYRPNRAVLHGDITFMPPRKRAWASWCVLHETGRHRSAGVTLTYWMNRLQPLPTARPVFVTLNPSREPDPDLVYDDHLFRHPLFDEAAILAQAQLPRLQGVNRFWFCGAYGRYGFHEDGLSGAVDVAGRMGISVPWR